LEAFLCGVVMCWLGTPFIRDGLPANGLIPHLFGCSLFGLQWIAVAATLRLTSRLPAILAAVLSASAATGAELLQALFGLPWVFMALALPAAPTPLAQWACWLTIFGVSFILYLVNFLWLPDLRAARWRRWLAPALGLVVALSARIGGSYIESRVQVKPLPFRTLIVQPYGVRQLTDESPNPSDLKDPLQTLTEESLQGGADPDLIVWPEASRPAVELECYADSGTKSVPEFFRWPSPSHRGTLLVGTMTKAAGRDLYNSACLVRADGSLDRHDKLALVWLTERLPPFLDFFWFRSNVLPRLGVSAPLRPGADYADLSFTDRGGRRILLGVSICYEMYFPWLPQYRRASEAEVVVHISSETGLNGHPFLSDYENWTCQYRAIETRRWQLLCTTMGNSAFIDPSGALTASTNRSRGVILARH
jgi:apolipoprotein N-acyltransferase